MAGISFDFRNIVSSKKCAVPSPRIANLEIGDESPGIASESVFQETFLYDVVCRNDVKNNSNSNYGCDKQSDKNFLIHSQSSLSTSTCDARPSDKIKSTNDSDIDLDFLDLLKSADLPRAAESGAGNFNSEKTTFDNKMKIIPNSEVCDDLSNFLSSIIEKDEGSVTLEYCKTKSAEDSRIHLLDFDFDKNEGANRLSSNNLSLRIEGNLSDLLSSINIEDSNVTKDCLSPNNSSLKAEGNLSDLLSSINIEDSDVTKVESFNARNMCNPKLGNKSKIESESPVTDLSDLLSSIDIGASNGNKVGSFNSGCVGVSEAANELCLADLLSSIDIDESNKQDSTTLNSKQGNLHNMKDLEANNESCLADLLSSIDIDKSNKPTSAVISAKPLSSGNSNLDFNDNKCISDSLNDFLFDIESSASSSNSCSSSYSENGSNSPKDSSSKNNLLTEKIFESDSGYNSLDAPPKGFSFFNYSSDNQFSFNTLLTEKSHASIDVKRADCDNANEEMSMSDLMTIVSPEFKNPVLASLNKVEKHQSSINKNSSNVQDLIESLNNNDSCVRSNNLVDSNEKPMNYDCVDGRISKNVQTKMETIDNQGDALLGKDDVLTSRSDFFNDDDEQITYIDLRECIKCTDNQFTPSSPIKQDKSVEKESLECFSPSKILFYCEDKSPSDSTQNKSNPFEFQNVSPRKKSKVNTKQTLFSKALACKPKKNHILLQKVASIKNEVLNNIIHRPIFIDCDLPQPIVDSVIQADRSILSKVGRKYFGIDPPCELQ